LGDEERVLRWKSKGLPMKQRARIEWAKGHVERIEKEIEGKKKL